MDIGDTAIYMGSYAELPGNHIVAKAIDDRVGCYMMMETLMQQQQAYNDVYYVFSVVNDAGDFAGLSHVHRTLLVGYFNGSFKFDFLATGS